MDSFTDLTALKQKPNKLLHNAAFNVGQLRANTNLSTSDIIARINGHRVNSALPKSIPVNDVQAKTANSGNNVIKDISNNVFNSSFYQQVSDSKWELLRKGTIGGIGGVISDGPTPFTLGKLADMVITKYPEESSAYKIAKWYQDHFNPKHFLKNRLDTRNVTLSSENDNINSILTRDKLDISTLSKEASANSADTNITNELSRLQSRQSFLESTDFLDAKTGALKLKELSLELKSNPELFTKSEIQLFEDRQATVVDMSQIEKELANASKFWGGTGIFEHFAKGASFDIAEVLANDYLNTVLESKNGSWSAGLLLLPLGAVIPGGMETKIAWTAGVMLGGKLLDLSVPAASHKAIEEVLHSTNLDAATMSFAALMPVDGPELRLALVGSSWLIGRAYNYFELPDQLKKKV